MNTQNQTRIWRAGAALVGAALLLGTPVFAADRSAGRSGGQSDSRSESRNESRSESRPAPRSEPRSETRATPTFRSGGSSNNDSPGPSAGWRSAPPAPNYGARSEPVNPGGTWRGPSQTPVPSPAPIPTPAPRSGSDTRFSPYPVGAPESSGGPSFRATPSPNTGGTPSSSNLPSNRWGGWRSGGSGNSGGSAEAGRSNGGNWRSGGSDNPGSSGRADRSGGGWRSGGSAPSNPSDDRNRGDIGDGTSTPPPSRSGGSWRGGNPSGSANGGLQSPSHGSGPGSVSRSNPVVSWRPPRFADRDASGGRGTGTPRAGRGVGSVPRAGSAGSAGSLPIGVGPVRPGGHAIRYITPLPGTRPPRVNPGHWGDGGHWYGNRDFDRVPIGYIDPWACYRGTVFSASYFYFPYYYTGPWAAGFYYSPFRFYDGWFPTYIYPERVIIIEHRIYLRDVVSDDNYYDPYGDVQSSLTETLDDIKSAWLNGDGGRLLQHINAAVPVRIYQRGEYKYSLDPDDYRDITKDALNRVETVSFEWTRIDKKSSDEVDLEARHMFRDPDGDEHTIRLTYTLEKARGDWWITQTGTAPW